mmetsp:Transcript_17518/g.37867  ORF Transcript_17518/g.37867 Transcript_17518/m.37867 type:complete len:81 (-) Transcript_17518:72-314(-)|eukprot:CAMPEP_0172525904 /NCGR_PEP_ID=MMETSP1067-20121228/910_1 /TAXON_ID=265564 ORGANISM="Thalassiosira punctigera, Strain Tpunct2005C2" /NCGR_SAMPLE_ID=MMETSP1067 /ASSEMBLY_ACC=CAM_ASM_000444 /LENGTH=80 /DNA_ID=CAMNT_0013309291 /DNA_START=279 /DNA_END=521 /DNA_ORIENTATION=+
MAIGVRSSYLQVQFRLSISNILICQTLLGLQVPSLVTCCAILFVEDEPRKQKDGSFGGGPVDEYGSWSVGGGYRGMSAFA